MRLSACELAPFDWTRLSIKDACLQITSGGTPRRDTPLFFENGEIIWVKTKELSDMWIYETEEKITKEAIKKSSAKIFPKNTVLMAMYGATVGKLGILANEAACNQACCAMIVNPKFVYFRYLYYQLLFHRDQIKKLASGAAQQNLSCIQIGLFKLPFPDLSQQQAIAEILGALDDKIELNRQMNVTLEAMAQALFKSWFIDFDPVHAKAQGRQPEGMSEEIAALFPDTMANNFPEKWNFGRIGDIFSERNERNKDDVLKNVFSATKDGIVLSDDYFNKCVYSKNLKNYKLMAVGDIAYNPSRANIGSIGFNWHEFDGVVSPIYVVCKPKSLNWSIWFSYFIKENSFKEQVSQLSSGTVRQNFNSQSFLNSNVILPSECIVDVFVAKLKSFREKMINIKNEIKNLSLLRDTLLPKLLSGEISIRTAEREVSQIL